MPCVIDAAVFATGAPSLATPSTVVVRVRLTEAAGGRVPGAGTSADPELDPDTVVPAEEAIEAVSDTSE